MAIVYLTKGLGLREENADAKTYLTKSLGLRTETQAAAGATAVPVFMHHYMQQRGA